MWNGASAPSHAPVRSLAVGKRQPGGTESAADATGKKSNMKKSVKGCIRNESTGPTSLEFRAGAPCLRRKSGRRPEAGKRPHRDRIAAGSEASRGRSPTLPQGTETG